jgi:beta-mannosidase
MYTIHPTFENFLYGSQIVQAEGMKIAIEAHRRAKPYCMGTLYWQLNDVWPVASWSGMDYYGKWKALQYSIKHAFDDYLVSAVKEGDSVQVYAVSDVFRQEKARVQLSLIDFSGKVLKTAGKEFDVPENSSTLVYAFKESDWVSAQTATNSVLNLKFFVEGKEVAQNNYYFNKPKQLAFPDVKLKIRQVDEKTLEVSSDKLAKSVWLYLPGTVNAFSDNYFDLLPGEKIRIEVKTDDMKAAIKKIKIKTLADVD